MKIPISILSLLIILSLSNSCNISNSRMITIWENFNADAIMTDFYATLEGDVEPAPE